jgi:transcriptional regulator with XRE-family HTH domain
MSDAPKQTLATWLAQREMSQAEFAKRIGATPASVSRWISGKSLPRRGALRAIDAETDGAVTADSFAALVDMGEGDLTTGAAG